MLRSVKSASLLALALCALSVPAHAQRGGGGGGGGRQRRPEMQDAGQGNFGPLPAPPGVTSIALDRAKDLELNDTQKSALEALRTSQDSMNTPLRARLDSLRPTRMPAGGPGDVSQDQRDEMEARMKSVQLLMEGFKSNNDVMREKVMAVLSPDQQKKFKDYEDEEQKKFEEESRRRSRGNRGRPTEN